MSPDLKTCSDCGAVYAPATVPDGECPACRAELLEGQLFEARDQLGDAIVDRDILSARRVVGVKNRAGVL